MSENGLTMRRARFIYEAARLAAIEAEAPVIPKPWIEREGDFSKQFLEVIERQCGPNRSHSPEELHDGWVQAYLKNGWRYAPKYDPELRTHPDMVPYSELGRRERDKDAVFIALCEIARLYIHDGPEEPRPSLGENQVIENRGGQDVAVRPEGPPPREGGWAGNAGSPAEIKVVPVEFWFQGGAIEIGHLPEDLAALETVVVSRHDESRGGIRRNYRMRRFPPDSVPRTPGEEPRIVFQEIVGDEPGPEEPGVPWS